MTLVYIDSKGKKIIMKNTYKVQIKNDNTKFVVYINEFEFRTCVGTVISIENN